MRREILLLLFFIIIYIAIRSIYFTESLNFSTDQALFSTRALEIWRNKEITLIGPPISLQLEGRQIFQGGAIYYAQLFFLLLGNFDPVQSTYAFTIFSGLMIIPLYLGMQWLSNKTSALFVVILYSLLPVYIIYTKFLWNPNFQLALMPLVIFFLGLYYRKKNIINLFLFGLSLGLITQFHFQGFIVTVLVIILLDLRSRLSIKILLIAGLGYMIGLGNLILFDVRNQFYNTQTFFLFLQKFLQFSEKNSSNFLKNPHYFLSILLISIVLITYLLRERLSPRLNIAVFLGLGIISIISFNQKPQHGFGMAENWQYKDEVKTYQLIRQANVQNYNIANLIYDTKAATQKYLHRKDNVIINEEEYRNNEYLFVLNKDNKYVLDPAYEVNTFKPSKLIQHWTINDHYQLYLLQRL